MMNDCQWVASRVEPWTNRGVSYVLCNHVYRPMVCRCGAQRWWSTVKVEVMRVRDEGLGVVKNERWDLTEELQSSND
jgi:hypothetical protein